MDTLAIAGILAVANTAIVNYLAEPIRKAQPGLSLWWLVYVSFVTGGVLAWFSGIDLFSAYVANPIASRIVTAAAVGGGSNLLHEIFGRRDASIIALEIDNNTE